MYSTQPNGAEGATINPATINPAALNSELAGNPNARGLKRSRSPETSSSYQPVRASGTPGDDGADNPRKRGRPMKPRSGGLPEPHHNQAPPSSHIMPPVMAQPHSMTPQTPQAQNAPLPGQAGQYTPAPAPQTSPPPKTTPTKSTLKALPTVRDHTTDQLGPGGDEYIPREVDEAGEKKVMPNGQLLGNREYRCRTFLVPNRGDKLFMLATECARVLGYRDSYLLFNKNRSLFKIIANQVEKDDLVQQEILPFSYRSRQIAIVTARSMFRQFGSRVITSGRRVRDDYWEGKARKQGFTEADLAGEKRPGAAKAREAAAEASNHPPPLVGGPQGEIVYHNTPGHFGAPQPQLVQPDLSDTRTRDYSNFIKGGPRQEITGPAYQDRTQSSPLTDIHAQAHHAAEFNRSVNQGREMRADFMNTIWRRPHEQPAPAQAPVAQSDAALPTTRPGQSPHATPASIHQPSAMVPNQSPQMMMTAAPYSQTLHSQQQQQQQPQQQPQQPQQQPMSQAPMRGMPQAPTPKQQQQSRPPSLPSGGQGNIPQTGAAPSYNNYGGQEAMWSHHQQPQTPQHYQGYTTQAQQSPHPQQSPAPQLRHPSNPPQMQPNSIQYANMPGMNQGYGNPTQGMYPPEQTPRQFMPQNPANSPAVTQSWSPQTSAAGTWWANQPQ